MQLMIFNNNRNLILNFVLIGDKIISHISYFAMLESN